MFKKSSIKENFYETLLKIRAMIKKCILKKGESIDIHKQVAILNKQIHDEMTKIELVLTKKYRMTFDKRQEELVYLRNEARVLIKTLYPELLSKNAVIERYQWYVNYYKNVHVGM